MECYRTISQTVFRLSIAINGAEPGSKAVYEARGMNKEVHKINIYTYAISEKTDLIKTNREKTRITETIRNNSKKINRIFLYHCLTC